MKKNKKAINPNSITGWLASTGYLLPQNTIELANFEATFSGIDYKLQGNEINPKKIISNTLSVKKKKIIKIEFQSEESLGLAALLSDDDAINFPKPPLTRKKKRK